MTSKTLASGGALFLGALASSLGLAFLAPACSSSGGSAGVTGKADAGLGDDGGTSLLGGDTSVTGTSPPGCTGLQCQQHTCGSATTTLSGHVYDPAGKNPLYKVVVYVPNSDPEPIADGITSGSCSCDSLFTGDPIATAITDADGKFTLYGAPDGTDIPLVVQIGKWRNYFTIPKVSECTANDLDTLLSSKLTLPKTQNETKFSNIPSIAISTGQADSLECLLLRVGVDASEYTGDPTSTASHIHIFAGTPVQGTVPNTNPPGPSSSGTGGLWDTDGDIDRYDVVLLSCEGTETGSPSPAVLADYVNGGGRVFASHYHYAFFFDDQTNMATPEFANVADWTLAYQGATGSDDYGSSLNATIATTLGDGGSFPEGVALGQWLGNVGALSSGDLPIVVGRHDGVVGPTNVSTVWASSTGVTPASSQYFSFDMPFDAGLDDAGNREYCGRVVYSDLHVGAGEGDYGCTGDPNNCTYTGTTPSGCHQGTLLPDEDAIEFILFDLSSCVTPVSSAPQPPQPK